MRSKLYKFQKKGVRKIEHFNGRALLADEMGLGKTIQALQYCFNHPEKRPVVIVCPASLKWVWEIEASLHFNIRSEVLNGRTPPKKGLLDNNPFIILNYEILAAWLPYLLKLKPQILLVDECHYIKNKGTRKNPVVRTKAVKQLSKKIPHIIAISGTPLTNRPSELYTTLNLIRPKEFKSFIRFAFQYCKPSKRPWGWEYKGACNLAELHRKLNRLMMIRRLKKDVLKELSDKTRIVVPLDIENRKEYDEALNSFIKWLTKKSITKAKKAEKAKKLVQLGYLKRLSSELKMKGVLDWIDNFLEEDSGKLVLYAVHRKIIKQIYERYKKIAVVVDGSVTGKKRKLAVRSFQKNKKVRIFIGNIKAAGVGITLTASSTLAFVEMDWTPGDHTQAEDRIHRIGQKNAAMIYYLIAKGTMEEDLCELIQKKQRTLSAILDGSGKVNDLNVFDQLETILKGK